MFNTRMCNRWNNSIRSARRPAVVIETMLIRVGVMYRVKPFVDYLFGITKRIALLQITTRPTATNEAGTEQIFLLPYQTSFQFVPSTIPNFLSVCSEYEGGKLQSLNQVRGLKIILDMSSQMRFNHIEDALPVYFAYHQRDNSLCPLPSSPFELHPSLAQDDRWLHLATTLVEGCGAR